MTIQIPHLSLSPSHPISQALNHPTRLRFSCLQIKVNKFVLTRKSLSEKVANWWWEQFSLLFCPSLRTMQKLKKGQRSTVGSVYRHVLYYLFMDI